MDNEQTSRLAHTELKVFFDRLFTQGFSGSDARTEIAPEGWEKSPLLACFHPSPEQVLKECVRMRRRVEELRSAGRTGKADNPPSTPEPEPTLAEVKASWKNDPVNPTEEITELVGRCLWDVFSDGHEVVASDGRLVDLGSFRAAGGFIASCVGGTEPDFWGVDYPRFYMGGPLGLPARTSMVAPT